MIDGDASGDRTRSFRSILKSTSLVGAASALNILVGMFRTKFVAVLIGPAGVGLIGSYSQLVSLAATVSGMGVDTSGVRQVAEAVASDDQRRIARTVVTLRRTALLTGALGMIGLAALSLPFARLTFGDDRHTLPIALLGVTLLLSAISAGQSSLLRGARKIREVAAVGVLSGLGTTVVSIPCYWAWGVAGVAPGMILSAVVGLGISWWYSRRVTVPEVFVSWRESRAEAAALLSLGASFMVAGLILNASIWLNQTILIRRFGVSGLGLYNSAFALSGILANFVLGAMAADYYPRLTGASGNDATTLEMVNDQSQVSTLLAGPGIAAMIVFSPLVIRVFYAPAFADAVPILRWCALGVFGRVLSWPLGFIALARGYGRLFLVTEAGAAGLHVLLVLLLSGPLGLAGAGIAFLLLYVAYTAAMLVVARRLLGRSWTSASVRINVTTGAALALLALNGGLNPEPISRWAIGVAGAAAMGGFSLRALMRRAGVGWRALLRRVWPQGPAASPRRADGPSP